MQLTRHRPPNSATKTTTRAHRTACDPNILEPELQPYSIRSMANPRQEIQTFEPLGPEVCFSSIFRHFRKSAKCCSSPTLPPPTPPPPGPAPPQRKKSAADDYEAQNAPTPETLTPPKNQVAEPHADPNGVLLIVVHCDLRPAAFAEHHSHLMTITILGIFIPTQGVLGRAYKLTGGL